MSSFGRHALAFAVAALTAQAAMAEDWSPLWTAANLSQARHNFAGAAINGKVAFGGGVPNVNNSNVVDIYNVATDTWSTASLSIARQSAGAAAAGGKIFFAGGSDINNASTVQYSRVDIYDTVANTWSTAELSVARSGVAASAIGTKVIFAGGARNGTVSNVVDIYDTATNTWSVSTLPQAQYSVSGGVALGNKSYIGGGYDAAGFTNLVQIYDNTTNTWSTTSFISAQQGIAAAAAGDKVMYAANGSVYLLDTTTNSWSTTSIAPAASPMSGAAPTGKILFAGGMLSISGPGVPSNAVNIYDVATNTWSSATLSAPRGIMASATLANKAFFAGGFTNSTDSKVIDIYTSQNYGSINSAKAFTLVDQTNVAGAVELASPAVLKLGGFKLTAPTVHLAGGAILGGTGNIAGSITVDGGAALANEGLIDLLDNVTGNTITLSDPLVADTVLTLGGANVGEPSRLRFDIGIGSQSDLIFLTAGKLVANPGGATVEINLIGSVHEAIYDLIRFNGGQASGLENLSLATNVLPGGYRMSLRTTSNAEQLVVTAPVPEPTALTLAAVGLLGINRRRRRA